MKKALTILTFIGISGLASAQQTSDSSQKTPLVIEYSLLDLPFNSYGAKSIEGNISSVNENGNGKFSNAVSFSSPEQATQITNGIIMAGHWGISKIPLFSQKNPKVNTALRVLLTGGFDILMFSAPYGSGWVHEEGHRAIMATSYTYSYNPFVFNKKAEDASGGSLHSVSYVLDTNLAMMKAKDNANFVRMSTMGGEMNIYSVMKMQQTSFFHSPVLPRTAVKPLHSIYYLLNLLNTSLYIATCGDKDEMTKETLEQIDREGAKQHLRDFTGLDFSAWAYDLSHPYEPYANRGLNPYGNGYDRYIYGNKLTDAQYDWIKKQSILSYINLLSPMSIFIDKIAIGNGRNFNFSGRYYPTSFGNQIGIELYYQNDRYNVFLAPHINQNKSNVFPGVEAMMYEKPFSLLNTNFLGTIRVIADLQPRDQEFLASKMSFAGLLGGRIAWEASNVLYPYISVEAKNRGWVAGNPFLDGNVSFKAGLSARFN